MSQRIPHLYIAPSNIDDRGVFSSELIPEGSVIEIAMVIIIPFEEMKLIGKTVLYNYYFDWDEKEGSGSIALGYGSLYNHSFNPNAEYQTDYESRSLRFVALRDIPPHEEITINYNGDPENQEKVWFED